MKLMDLKSLAVEKSISVTTLRRLLNRGMPHYRPGRKIYINPDEFDAWFRNRFWATKKNNTITLDKLMEDAIDSIN